MILGDTWDLLYGPRDMEPKQKEKKEHSIPHIHSVFYEMLAMAMRVNRKKMKYCAFIHSVSNYAQGGGQQSADKAFVYFEHSLTHHSPMHHDTIDGIW